MDEWPLGCRSTHVGYSFLRLGLNGSFWSRRQLKNRSLLIFGQECQKHDLAVRKLQRIVMGRDLFLVDLPKDRGGVVEYFIPPTEQTAS